MPSRRHFISQTVALGAAPLLIRPSAAPATFNDVNVHLHHWPHYRLAHDTPETLAAHLRAHGVTQAWVGSYDALFQQDLASVNARIAADCARAAADLFLPIGTLSPTQPGWRDDLKRCQQDYGMKALRLYPGFHHYTLDDAPFLQLLEAASSAHLPIQIVSQLEDARTQHPALQAPSVNLKPLPALLKAFPDARVMVLNASSAMIHTALQPLPNGWIDIAKLEGCGGIETLLKTWPVEQIAFGSNAPFFYWQAAKLKLQESALSPAQIQKLTQPTFLLPPS
jgi:predicted TIM-barrel fold metal-dependent hydrolase